MPPDSNLRRQPAPFRYPLPQAVEWRALVSETAHVCAESRTAHRVWSCVPPMRGSTR